MATTVLSEPERFLIWNIFQDKVVASSVTAEETFFGDNLEHIDSVDSMLL